ncbi:unnamed protein product [Euphydryas editha]|uniref:Uncharacterized protein n=1 Tax=Euphydryas editha TaxID=104508 RepID=A0AAU9UWU8_EUPED|nr:unnamed protein product [Euphydryas editha]
MKIIDKYLDTIFTLQMDEELLKKINVCIPPENPDNAGIPSCSRKSISAEERTTTTITNTSSHFVIETVAESDHLVDPVYTQPLTLITEDFPTTTITDISSNIYTVEVLATTKTIETPNSYVIDTISEMSAVPPCSSTSTFVEAVDISATSFISNNSETTDTNVLKRKTVDVHACSSNICTTFSENRLMTTTAVRVCDVLDSTEEIIAAPSCSNIPSLVEGTDFSAAIVDDTVTVNLRKRNKHALPENWKKNVIKEKRMRGESYLGYARDSNKTITADIPRDERKIGPTCETNFCLKSSKRFCSLFSEDDRQNMFNNFWKEMDWTGKKSFVCSLVDKIPVKQKRSESGKRPESLVYYLKLNGEARQVCKKMFLNTLGLKERMVFNWVNQSIPLISSKKERNLRGKRKSTFKVNEEGVTQAEHLIKFFNDIPKLPSHYCRSTTSRLYLEPIFKSKSHLYDVYKQKCNEEAVHPVSSCYFDNKFEELNLSICKPKKDRCDVCSGFETKNVTQEEYDRHIEKKKAARLEKEADKKLAIDGKITALCMDVQSVKVCPKVQASAVYYKTKLCCHNFTVYNMATNSVVCYWWHECEGELQASNFASCLSDYIMEKVDKSIPLVIYSDGCTSQNRNATMANALLDLSIKNNMQISQKYLEKGHTQMECDSVHSVIEIKLKNTDIHLPIQYVTLTKDAKKKNPKYEAKYLSFDFFKNFTQLQRYQSIRPGKKTGDPTVTDIRQLNYESVGKIKYKLSFSDELQNLPFRPKTIDNCELRPMYTQRIPLKQRKWKDLQDLKAILPKDFHSFYDSLPKTD